MGSKLVLSIALVVGLTLTGCSAATIAGSSATTSGSTTAPAPSTAGSSESPAAQTPSQEAQAGESLATADSQDSSESTGSVAQQNALEKAESYLEFSAFSRSGLIDQLEFEGFDTADATWAVDHLTVDWNEQAALKAASYLDSSSFSRSGLIDQLKYEGFTAAQARFGVSQAYGSAGGQSATDDSQVSGARVAQENALAKAESYLEFSAFSRSGLIDQLEFEGFDTADATWAVEHLTVDWNEQAALKAASYLDSSSFSRSGLIDQLKYEGFTSRQAEYGVSQTGL